MAVKSGTGLTYRDILTQIKKKDLAPFYLLQGEESYYLDLLADAFESAVIDENERDFNQTVLYGAETDLVTITGAAQQYPFMADRRLVIVKEAQAMTRGRAELEQLAPYVERPNSKTVLVVVYKGEPLKSSHPLVKSANKNNGIIFTSNKLKDYQLKGAITDYVSSRKFGIDNDAAEMLGAMVGSDLSKLFGEVDKMIIAAGDKMSRISANLVRSMTGISKEFAPYELSGAIGRRDYLRAMVIVSQAAKNPSKNPVLMILPSIFKLFQNICIAHRLEDKSDMGLQMATGAKNVFSIRELREAMKNYNLGQAVNAISAIREFDCNIKGIRSQQKEHELLKELIFKLMS